MKIWLKKCIDNAFFTCYAYQWDTWIERGEFIEYAEKHGVFSGMVY